MRHAGECLRWGCGRSAVGSNYACCTWNFGITCPAALWWVSRATSDCSTEDRVSPSCPVACDVGWVREARDTDANPTGCCAGGRVDLDAPNRPIGAARLLTPGGTECHPPGGRGQRGSPPVRRRLREWPIHRGMIHIGTDGLMPETAECQRLRRADRRLGAQRTEGPDDRPAGRLSPDGDVDCLGLGLPEGVNWVGSDAMLGRATLAA